MGRHLGFTKLGEIFTADHMAALAAQFYGMRASVVNWDTHQTIVEHLEFGGLCMVAYDKDGNHEPAMKGGTKAHWTLIHGYAAFIESDEPAVEFSSLKDARPSHAVTNSIVFQTRS
ncbi:hypothetical protein HK101_003213 [Irineochytrium annulatum]|nr:hypothetical protein HK101_003213 [Irineochytrium annulatum]